VCSGEADLEALDFAEPAVALGFGDTGEQVVTRLGNAVALSRIGPQQRASDAPFS
jgi:hypothetical protein